MVHWNRMGQIVGNGHRVPGVGLRPLLRRCAERRLGCDLQRCPTTLPRFYA